MITSVNGENSVKYQALFADASEALNNWIADPNNGLTQEQIDDYGTIEISTLNEYFCYIEELAALDMIYTVLPLDEETFDIDANTRMITIPPSFKKNGVGVQGDHTAEAVYFTIDRYFDNVDLGGKDVKIYIQCEFADEKGRAVKKVYPAFIKDISSRPNMLIFGWILIDELTQNSGNIKFSVRFTKEENNEIIYNLGTLTATVIINKAINYNLLDGSIDIAEVSEISDLIKRRLFNSEADGATQAAKPEWIIEMTTEGELRDNVIYVDLDENGEYVFYALAKSTDAGLISYTWKMGEDDVEGENVYIEANGEYRTDIPYYTKGEDGNYHRLNVDPSTLEEGIIVYERRGSFVATEVGEYQAVAINKVGSSKNDLASKIAKIPGPEAPKNVVAADKDMEAGYVRKVITDGAEVELSISAEKGAEGDAEVSYKWYMSNSDPDAAMEDETLEKIYLAEEGAYSTTTPGWYSAEIVGNRNKAIVSFPSNEFYRVTVAPDAPTFITPAVNQEVYISLAKEISVVATAEHSDEITYQWYAVKLVPGETADDITDDELLVGKTNSTMAIAATDAYLGKTFYCIATNHYNGASIAGGASPRFEIKNQ